jgi:hypothetical protein
MGLEAAVLIGLVIGAVYALTRGGSFRDVFYYAALGAVGFGILYLIALLVAYILPLLVAVIVVGIIAYLVYVVFFSHSGRRRV